jgi:hypothetical protein
LLVLAEFGSCRGTVAIMDRRSHSGGNVACIKSLSTMFVFVS